MSLCSACLQGMCRRHPSQDHGVRAAEIQSRLSISKGLLKKSYDTLIQAQLERLQNETRGTSSQEIDNYKEQVEQEREHAMKKKRKKVSLQHERLALTTGLCGSVISAMVEESETSDHEIEKKKRKKRSNESSDEEKDARKSQKKSKKKRDKKEKKKKEKKSKESKKKSKRQDSSSSSSSNSEEG
jgi:hypothetical protein